jgi:putative ATP-dependent endonuclease of OLD family
VPVFAGLDFGDVVRLTLGRVRVVQIDYRRFRGFKKLKILPRGHVVLIGEPRAGRSDALEGLARALGGGGGRLPDPDELDFYERDTTARAEVEVVLSQLGPALQQLFFDQLEFWDSEEEELIDELDQPEELDSESVLTVIRVCYRLEWDEDEGVGHHWVDFPKSSDPSAGIFRRLSRVEREAIPFVGWTASGRVLSLAPRSSFRELAEEANGDGLADALEELVEQLERLGADLAGVDQVEAALEAVVAPWRHGLKIGDTPVSEIVSFLPEGGAIAAILRSLAPALELPNGPVLPLSRHGSTTHALALHGQLIARASAAGIVALDDFGDRVDAASARHSATLLRRSSGQLWMSTRIPQVADAFAPEEVIRLSWSSNGRRIKRYGRLPSTKAERLAARHMGIQILPAMAASSVVIVEGPHDRAALNAVMDKLASEEGVAGFAAHRIALIDAGAADAAGGISSVSRIADAAGDLGFHTIAVVDYDRANQAETELATAIDAADAVIRLPEGFAIERSLCAGLDDQKLVDALGTLADGFDLQLPADYEAQEGDALLKLAIKALKRSGGLHAEFVAALEVGDVPPTARELLAEAIAAGRERKTGHIQL